MQDLVKEFREKRSAVIERQEEQLKVVSDKITIETQESINEVQERIDILVKKQTQLYTERDHLIELRTKQIAFEHATLKTTFEICDDEFLSLLERVMDGAKLFFTGTDKEELVLFEEKNLDLFLEMSNLPSDFGTKIFEWIREHIELKSARAKCYLGGRVEGYKGDETEFKLDWNKSIEVDGYEDYEPYDEEDVWEEYVEDDVPDRNDIDWPDHKSTWATAVIWKDVTVLVKK